MVKILKYSSMILLSCTLILGCKTRKSHVKQRFSDSVVQNREQNNSDILATSIKEVETSQTQDSAWVNIIQLDNFTGTIKTNGKIEGTAQQAKISHQGSKNHQQRASSLQRDSVRAEQQITVQENTAVTEQTLEKEKQTKAAVTPWWIWMVAIIAIMVLGYVIINKMKWNINPFKRK